MITEKVVAVVCLQAQHVAGLPAAAEGRQILLHLLQQQVQLTGEDEAAAAATARCRGRVAAFHDQVLLLHCAPLNSIASIVTVAVTVDDSHDHAYTTATSSTIRVNLAEQLHRPSPSVLSFVLGGAAAAAGAVLSLTLHHRLRRRRRSACPSISLPHLLLNCLRMPVPPAAHNEQDNDDDGESSSGFITIDKGTISRRRPPSDNLLTTDDEEGDGKPALRMMALAEELEVEDQFLTMLDLEADHHRFYDGDLDLDTLIKDAEADLAAHHR